MEPEGFVRESGSTRAIRVAQIITSVVLGGGGQVMSALARNIDTSKFSMDVFCVLEGGELVEYIRSLGFQVEILPICRSGGLIRYDVRHWLRLVARLRHGGYDIVHTHLFRADLVGAAAAIVARRIAIVKTLHNMGTRKRRYHRMMDLVLNGLARRVVCVSETQRQVTISRDGVDPSKVVSIRNGVQMDRFRPVPNRESVAASVGLDASRPIVGTVGRLIEEKGQTYLLRAIPEIARRVRGAQFLIVGDGDMRRELERQMKGMPGVTIVITGLRPDVPELLGIMDVFAFPSLSEGSPIAALEAMAAGVALVCSDIPALKEIIRDGETGLIVPARNSVDLAEAICRLLEDSQLRASLVQRARAMVGAEYTEAAMVRAYERLYLSELQRTTSS